MQRACCCLANVHVHALHVCVSFAVFSSFVCSVCVCVVEECISGAPLERPPIFYILLPEPQLQQQRQITCRLAFNSACSLRSFATLMAFLSLARPITRCELSSHTHTHTVQTHQQKRECLNKYFVYAR